MKISNMIAQLEKIKEDCGDGDVTLVVKDHYSRFGRHAHFLGESRGELWASSHQNCVQVFVALDEDTDCDGNLRYPKITFRRP